MNTASTPESTLPIDDVGADVQRRFRYQNAYAARLALELLRPEPEFDLMYVEYHDDILLRTCDGHYRAVQVKTRQPKLGGFKAGDDEIKGALKRFVQLEATWPGRFDVYAIATNTGLWQEKENSSSLPHILNTIYDCQTNGNAPPPLVEGYVSKLVPKGADPTACRVTLSKVRQLQGPSGLDNVEDLVARHLCEILPNSLRTMRTSTLPPTEHRYR